MNNYALHLICLVLRMQMKLSLVDILPMSHHYSSLPLQLHFPLKFLLFPYRNNKRLLKPAIRHFAIIALQRPQRVREAVASHVVRCREPLMSVTEIKLAVYNGI